MNMCAFEIGLGKTDVQSKNFEFNGSLEQYLEESLRDIEANKDLEVIDGRVIDAQHIVIDYYSKPMKKMIRHYAFIQSALVTA